MIASNLLLTEQIIISAQIRFVKVITASNDQVFTKQTDLRFDRIKLHFITLNHCSLQGISDEKIFQNNHNCRVFKTTFKMKISMKFAHIFVFDSMFRTFKWSLQRKSKRVVPYT